MFSLCLNPASKYFVRFTKCTVLHSSAQSSVSPHQDMKLSDVWPMKRPELCSHSAEATAFLIYQKIKITHIFISLRGKNSNHVWFLKSPDFRCRWHFHWKNWGDMVCFFCFGDQMPTPLFVFEIKGFDFRQGCECRINVRNSYSFVLHIFTSAHLPFYFAHTPSFQIPNLLPEVVLTTQNGTNRSFDNNFGFSSKARWPFLDPEAVCRLSRCDFAQLM